MWVAYIFFQLSWTQKKKEGIPSNVWSTQRLFLDPANRSSFHGAMIAVAKGLSFIQGSRFYRYKTAEKRHRIQLALEARMVLGLRTIRFLISSLPFWGGFFRAQLGSHFQWFTWVVLDFAEAPSVQWSPKPREKMEQNDDLDDAWNQLIQTKLEKDRKLFFQKSSWRQKKGTEISKASWKKTDGKENSSFWIGWRDCDTMNSETKIWIHILQNFGATETHVASNCFFSVKKRSWASWIWRVLITYTYIMSKNFSSLEQNKLAIQTWGCCKISEKVGGIFWAPLCVLIYHEPCCLSLNYHTFKGDNGHLHFYWAKQLQEAWATMASQGVGLNTRLVVHDGFGCGYGYHWWKNREENQVSTYTHIYIYPIWLYVTG